MKRLLFLPILLVASFASAQCDSIANSCEHHISTNYISDGQVYRALLNGDQVAEFQVTMFQNNTYRIAACSGESDSNLIFRLYDQENNLLFTNTEYANAPYWDFHIEHTMQVTIEAQLDSFRAESGCAVIVLGFKR